MESNDRETPKELSPLMDRRGFLGASLASALIAAGVGLAGCAPRKMSETAGEVENGQRNTALAELPEGGRWQPIPCMHNCTNQCVNMGYVVDGKVVRQKTDDVTADEFGIMQERACIKGRALRYKYDDAGRLNFPIKRKSWQPGGGEASHGELRGRDEWERISWDEALRYTADEIKRVKDAYGNRALWAPGVLDYRQGMNKGWLLNAMGGCVTCWGEASFGAFPLVSNAMTGSGAQMFSMMENDRYSLLDSKLVVIFGFNPSWTHPKYAHILRQAKEQNGAKFILVDPWFSPTAQAVADQWIPIRPGTDQAFLLGVAYHMIENNLQDQTFLDTYTVGFDADHMPADAKSDENFRDYVLGTYDGEPKTPEWASVRCGTDPAVIRAFAEEIAACDALSWRASCAPARTDTGEAFAQLFLTVGWMTGNVGRSGSEVAPFTMGSQMPLVNFGDTGIVAPVNETGTSPRGNYTLISGAYDPSLFYGFAYCEAYDAVINGQFHDFVHGMQPCDIRLIYNIGYGAPLNQGAGARRGIEAYRKVEFVVSSDLFMTTDCLYSDIVLPAASSWERPWGNVLHEGGSSSPTKDSIAFGLQVSEPAFERRSDAEIELALAKLLDIDEKVIQNISEEQASFNSLAGATYMTESGEMAPIATITEDDLASFGLEGAPQEGAIPLSDLLETGHYAVERSADTYRFTAFEAFIADPAANPVATPSGKFEIHCATMVDWFDHYGTTSPAPIPKYQRPYDGYENMFTDDGLTQKGEYDFQLVNTHYIGHAQSQFSNVPKVNELFPNDLVMNTADAERLGVKTGDTVLAESHYGKILRRVNVTPRIMPGVVELGQGNWVCMDESDEIDLGGSCNTLCGGRLLGQGHQPWNSCLLKIEKWDGEPLPPEWERLQTVFSIEA